MTAGDRGWHPAEKLTDWSVLTPFGTISPRNMHPLHMIRTSPELVKIMKMMMAEGAAGGSAARQSDYLRRNIGLVSSGGVRPSRRSM